MQAIEIRPATPADAAVLAELINYAGEGFPLYLWSQMAERDETPWDVGRRRARREEGSFSYRNAHMAESAGTPLATLIGYPLPAQPEPIDASTPPLFVPLLELEQLAPATWYVNVIAAYPEFRGRGIGTRLLGHAEALARDAGTAALSLIVADANEGARRLYRRAGYEEYASRPMVKGDWQTPGTTWILMVRSLS